MKLKRLKKISEADGAQAQAQQPKQNNKNQQQNQGQNQNNQQNQDASTSLVSQKAMAAMTNVMKSLVNAIPEQMKKDCPEFADNNADAKDAIAKFEEFKKAPDMQKFNDFMKSFQDFITKTQEKEKAPKQTSESFAQVFSRKLNEKRMTDWLNAQHIKE